MPVVRAIVSARSETSRNTAARRKRFLASPTSTAAILRFVVHKIDLSNVKHADIATQFRHSNRTAVSRLSVHAGESEEQGYKSLAGNGNAGCGERTRARGKASFCTKNSCYNLRCGFKASVSRNSAEPYCGHVARIACRAIFVRTELKVDVHDLGRQASDSHACAMANR